MTIKLTPSEQMKQTAKNLNGLKLDIRVTVPDKSNEEVTVPAFLLDIVQQLVTEIAKGNSITIIPSEQEISTNEAADILDISRKHLIDLLESGELPIPFRRVGKHRRFILQDVLSYKQKTDEQRLLVLQELANQAQELKLGYE